MRTGEQPLTCGRIDHSAATATTIGPLAPTAFVPALACQLQVTSETRENPGPRPTASHHTATGGPSDGGSGRAATSSSTGTRYFLRKLNAPPRVRSLQNASQSQRLEGLHSMPDSCGRVALQIKVTASGSGTGCTRNMYNSQPLGESHDYGGGDGEGVKPERVLLIVEKKRRKTGLKNTK